MYLICMYDVGSSTLAIYPEQPSPFRVQTLSFSSYMRDYEHMVGYDDPPRCE